MLRQAWDKGSLRTIVKNAPAKATGAHISVVGHISKMELLRYLNDIEAGNGFANRFLWMCSKRARVLPSGGGEVDYKELVPNLFNCLRQARTIGLVTRDAEAEEAWEEIYPELSEGKPGLFGAITARAEAQVLRLSVLYAVLDGSNVVKLPHLQAAVAVWDYAESSARYIFGDATGDHVADRILGVLRANPDGASRTDIYNYFGRNVPSSRLGQALDLLLQNKKATMQFEETEGRSKELWKAL